MKTILVLAAATQDDLDSDGAAVEVRCDTIREAKERARYYISPAYAKICEASQLGYARVLVDDENVFDVEVDS